MQVENSALDRRSLDMDVLTLGAMDAPCAASMLKEIIGGISMYSKSVSDIAGA